MCRTLSLLVILLLSVVVLAPAQEYKPRLADELRQLPIATGDSEIAKLLKQWGKEGTAAGNVGDWYDNRDGEHSPLDLKPWPQLQKVHYTEQMLKSKVNWAAARQVLPIVVFGNSSTSAGPTNGGSNPRQYYTQTGGINFLAAQYAKNNLYIYPEHRDHDPGRNGLGPGAPGTEAAEGYGDLYPTNTPYLIISQGSSGTDQPFMRAIPYVLAAFRPEVKAKLIEAGSLMPAVQMIFRMSNNHLKDESEYLTGTAHPTVFEGKWVDPLKMVKMAHEITADTLPPVVRIKAIAETIAKPGIDYFDPVASEALADTPQVIARIFRGKDRWRGMIVSAEDSVDPNGKKLKYEWRVLRGDPDGVKIIPKKADGSIVEIAVRAPTRRPVAPGSPIESPRVDIGVFVHNGHWWSAPAFITWYGLDNEIRDYDEKDRVIEMSDVGGEVRFAISDWRKLLSKDYAGFFPPLTPEQTDALAKLEKERAELNEKAKPPEGKYDAVLAKKYEAAKNDFKEKEKRKLHEILSPTHLSALTKLAKSDLLKNPEFQKFLAKATKAQLNQVERIEKGIRAFHVEVDPKLKDQPILRTPSAFDLEFRELINAERLNLIVFGGATPVQRHVNYTDSRLSTTRKWRDVYLYEPGGKLVGWARSHAEKVPSYFTADGLLVVDRDDLGRCKTAAVVKYNATPDPNIPGRMQLSWTVGEKIGEYVYDGPDDRRGKVKQR
jgi:hypothetical protein